MYMNISSLLSALPGDVAQGIIWGIMALGVFITFKLLDFADLSVDGSFATGGAVTVILMLSGMNSGTALFIAFLAGALAGFTTGILHTVFGIPDILAGILTQIALYSINLNIMSGKANTAISVDKFNLIVSLRFVTHAILVSLIFALVIICLMYWFFGTELGSALRATGANGNMARAQGINTNAAKVLGLMISNGFIAFSGALLSQFQGFSDINMGRGAIVIGLASVIIGEVIFGRIFRNFALKLLSSVIGAVIYYIVIQFVLKLGLSTDDLKLLTALVVAIFLAVPHLQERYRTSRGRKEPDHA